MKKEASASLFISQESTTKSQREEVEFDGERGGLAFGFHRLVEVEGFLGVPAFCVGAFGFSGGNVTIDVDGALVKLATLHVEISDLDFHTFDILF